ncbi:SHOCT domain-containing protein [Streptomyces sp. NPDC006385]|uniref:SHOCT domain-containing protein n=1 Tax=unclassified Streptomyces TaxID=2593676 RepID=UPI0033B47622
MCDASGTLAWFGAVLLTLLLVAGAVAALGLRRRRPRVDPGPKVPPFALDPAQQQLRRRYASGEIEREEFLQRKVDLEYY